ncbi:hypothetical protein J3E74DRAFT_329600 [Bipolaris maydis]|nr:hypothetical protein J3E74DRAFT_329600 [Bipolaris maydis]
MLVALRHGVLALLILSVAYWDRKGGGGSVLSVLLLECFCGCCSFARALASREAARGNALMSGLTRSAGPRADFEGF